MIRRFDAAAGNLFAILRTLALLCTVAAVLAAYVAGPAAAYPMARAAALCWLPVLAPPFFTWAFTRLSKPRAPRLR